MAARWRARLSRQVLFLVLPFGSTVVVGGSGRSEGAPVLGGDRNAAAGRYDSEGSGLRSSGFENPRRRQISLTMASNSCKW